jgi:crotonobetainyl-CoA:carnitine CoA-transferase CaiB-like acyl-CoA transferase
MRALDGIRVLDLSRHLAGPFVGVIMADHGADVIKVESLIGDPSRHTGADYLHGESALYLTWNRGKRSISVDYHRPEGVDVIRRLARDVDVVIENFRPGAADALGVGYEDLKAANPEVIYCSVNGFGSQGPLAGYPATDPIVQAMSGIMSVTGEEKGPPLLCGIPVADYYGALTATQGVLLALIARSRTGRGQRVEVTLISAVLAGLQTRFATHWASDREPVRTGNAHSVVVPYQLFRTSDGYAMAGIWGDESWGRFCAALGVPKLAEDVRFATAPDRLRNRDELIPILDSHFAERTTAEWEGRFLAESALFGPLLTIEQALSHPQVVASGLLGTVQHPTVGAVPQIGPPISMSDTPPYMERHPPLLGEHTREILVEAGFGDKEIGDLTGTGVVRTA